MNEGKDQVQAGEVEGPSQRQVDRASRAGQVLIKLGVPTYHRTLFVRDEDEVKLPGPIEVARRALGALGRGQGSGGPSRS